MAGFTPNEGETVIANMIYKGADANRGDGAVDLEVGLLTNAAGSLGETSTLANITEPAGGGYARQDAVNADWVVDGAGLAQLPTLSWVATGGAYSADVTGYFVATKGTVPKLLHVEFAPQARTMVEGAQYDVDLNNQTD